MTIRWTVVATRAQPDAQGRVAPADFIGTWSTTGWAARDVIGWIASLPLADAVYIGITRSEEP